MLLAVFDYCVEVLGNNVELIQLCYAGTDCVMCGAIVMACSTNKGEFIFKLHNYIAVY